MKLELSHVIGIIGLVLTVIGIALVLRAQRVAKYKDRELVRIEDRISSEVAAIVARLAPIEVYIDLLRNVVDKQLSKMLERPVHFRRDELLRKNRNQRLDGSERAELKRLLEKIVSGQEGDPKEDQIVAALQLVNLEYEEEVKKMAAS